MKKEISQEIATRKRSINYYSLGTSYLPDPDIVLRKQGKDLPVKPGDKIITSCQIDLRGYEAECILRGLGYENVHSLEGGMSGWPYATESDKKK